MATPGEFTGSMPAPWRAAAAFMTSVAVQAVLPDPVRRAPMIGCARSRRSRLCDRSKNFCPAPSDAGSTPAGAYSFDVSGRDRVAGIKPRIALKPCICPGHAMRTDSGRQ
jgi:hypothetical protein